MNKAVNLTYKGEDVKEFFVRASKLYKEANFNEGTKHGMIMETIKSDQIFFPIFVAEEGQYVRGLQ